MLSQRDWPGAAVLRTQPLPARLFLKMWLMCILAPPSFLISPTPIEKKTPALPQGLRGSRGVEGQQCLLRSRSSAGRLQSVLWEGGAGRVAAQGGAAGPCHRDIAGSAASWALT